MPRSYVDNAYNRSIGRVGMPVGSMVVSNGGGGGGYSSGGGGGGYSSGGGGGGYSSGGGSSYLSSSNASSTRAYVDNAYNRSAGRVGLPLGSAVISSGNSPSASGLSNSGSRGSSYSPNYFSANDSSTRTYVDNAFNRSAGRVGLPVGSAVISKTSGASSADKSRTPTTTPVSQANQQGATSKYSHHGAKPKEPKTYVDNAYNKKHNRVGLEHGTKPVSKTQPEGPSMKVYKNNELNRKLGRVGKAIGTAVFDNKTGKTAPRMYADTPQNRKLGRVGIPKGCQPTKRNGDKKKMSEITTDTRRAIEDYITSQPPSSEPYDDYRCNDWDQRPPSPYDLPCPEAENRAKYFINRKEEEIEWMTEENSPSLRTDDDLIANYKGSVIPLDDLELGRKIGEGGFGEVFFAKWHKTVVAVKKLRATKISKKREKQFSEEVLNFCNLDHVNIVKFLGVVTERPNLCIVMEYMQTSLFNVLFITVEEEELIEEDRQNIIDGMCAGLIYLHENGIAHCDIKSDNILLDNNDDGYMAKITDFGLSMVKTNTETSSAAEVERVQKVGTPRYSAPEVLRGEMLSRQDMMMADVYSLALVIFELVFEDEVYNDLSYAQLQKQVGERGLIPEMDDDTVDKEVVDIIKKALNFRSDVRPTAKHLNDTFLEMKNLYVEEKKN